MAVNLSALGKLEEAIIHFWYSRAEAARRQNERGITDRGSRSSVTAGKNLDGFIGLVKQAIIDNGIEDVDVFTQGKINITLPGFFRPTKNWDLLVVNKNQLLAVIEFKSQVGPSFGNNFNNRVEEALGNAVDLRTAFREGVFGESPKPFMGYFFVLEECDKSMSPVKFSSPHFPAMTEFENTSYAQRYEILCRRLVLEEWYDAASVILTRKDAAATGEYQCLSEMTGAKRFVATLAGKISAMAAQ